MGKLIAKLFFGTISLLGVVYVAGKFPVVAVMLTSIIIVSMFLKFKENY